MKVWEIIGTLATCGVLIQFLKWVFDLVGISESIGSPLTLFLSGIFTLLIIIIVILNQHNTEINKIKEYLRIYLLR